MRYLPEEVLTGEYRSSSSEWVVAKQFGAVTRVGLMRGEVLLSVLYLFTTFDLSTFTSARVSCPHCVPGRRSRETSVVLDNHASSLRTISVTLPSGFPSPNVLCSNSFIKGASNFE